MILNEEPEKFMKFVLVLASLLAILMSIAMYISLSKP